jgi:hypothetical protein
MNPIHRLIKIERIPSQLVGNVVNLLVGFVLWVGIVRRRLARLKVAVAARGEDAVKP